MDNLLNIQLRAFNPELKHDRAYSIILGRDLFNDWYVTIVFGRYRAGGTRKTFGFGDQLQAHKFIDARLKRRLSSPKRIGHPYQILSLEGSGAILEGLDKATIERFCWFNEGQPQTTYGKVE